VHHPAIPGGPLRAAVLERPDDIQVRPADDAEPSDGEALLRVRAVGICGTDLSIAHGKIPVSYPRVLGHEVVGEVVDPGAAAVPAGATVLVDPGLSCGTCTQCREGRTNICTRGGLLGRDTDGGLRDLLPVPATHVHELPSSVDATTAPMVQVLATCVHAQRLLPIAPGETVAVLGLGVTGLLHVQLAALRGARVLGITRSREKRALAEELGADRTFAADGTEAEAVATAVGEVDVVIECAGLVPTLARAVELARVGGRILAYGTIGHGADGSLPWYDLYYKELAIVGARSATPEDFVTSIDLVATGRVRLDPLVSERFPLDDVARAFDAASSSGALKILVDV
jgi:L-iditol 2-dehydrogenase